MTKDEIFAAMEKAYTGAGSTVEGSFAGDLLRACADGCAELWSTEIDGLEERAFVASAAGERVNARVLVGTADAAGLSRWEREYGLADRSGEDGARRRARVYAAMAGGQTLTRERLSALAVAVGGADRGEVTEDFAAYAAELAAIQDGRLPAPEGMAALCEAIARQKGAHLTVTAVPCAALTLDRAETLHGGALELAWGEIAEG